MSISCSCEYDGDGCCAVGDLKEMTCRTPRKCYSCRRDILAGDIMYRQNFYDYDEYKTAAPIFLCEECGDMQLNLTELGFCFDYSEGIRNQWLSYLRDVDPTNPAVAEAPHA